MNNIARLRIPSILALSVVVLTFAFAACGGADEAREDVPASTGAGETSADTSPTADASGGNVCIGVSRSDPGFGDARHFLLEP